MGEKGVKGVKKVLLLVVMVIAMVGLPGAATKVHAAEYPDYMSFTAVDGDVTIGMGNNGSPDDYVLEYSKDRQNWTSVTLTDTNESIVTIPSGETYYFRTDRERDGLGNGVTDDEELGYDEYGWNFLMTGEGKVKADGNVMSLLDPTCKKTSVGAYAFYNLFFGCKNLVAAPKLPAQTLADYCYYGMFSGCSSLTKAPALPAQTLAKGCYQDMFSCCDSLTEAPELPAQTLADSCYAYMFYYCINLTKAPELPAQTLADSCYKGMFFWCMNLEEAPELPAQTLADSCYSQMFLACSLKEAPELPAQTLTDFCYSEMFILNGLKEAPKLPAQTLTQGCYERMFYNCYNLEEAPKLPAQTLVAGCYREMFSGCTELSSVTVGFTGAESSLDSCLGNWLERVSETGTLLCPESTLQYSNEELGLPAGWVKKDVNELDVVDENDYLSFTAVDGDVTIGMNRQYEVNEYVLQYSKDKKQWITVTLKDSAPDLFTIPVGDTYYFRTDKERDCLSNFEYTRGYGVLAYWCFTISGDGEVVAGGNVMSLLDPSCQSTTLKDYALFALFSGCEKLVTAPKLPATTLGSSCYEGMFSGCGLTTAPELPAKIMADRCYEGMFVNCKRLTEAPELPAQTLEQWCYDGMFEGCSSLTKAPELPAQTLTRWCYKFMFSGCSKLSSVTVGFTEVEYPDYYTMDDCLENWLDGVSETGTLYCPESLLQYTNEELGLPAGWEKKDKEQIRRQINSFVTRMYEQCLSRDPDQAGLEGWAGQLENGNMNGADIAQAFVFSNEMLDKNLSDAEFVKALYRSMMGREADEAGLNGWVSQLQGGYLSRSEVTKAFVESTEFTGICTEYGITRGDFEAVGPIERFVTRFYTICLGRQADQKGHWGWVVNLRDRYMNGAQIADAFFFSDEFIGKNVSDEAYVDLLYRTIMGREPDEAGKSGWVNELKNGYLTRKDMLQGFIGSDEFGRLCEDYGINRGNL